MRKQKIFIAIILLLTIMIQYVPEKAYAGDYINFSVNSEFLDASQYVEFKAGKDNYSSVCIYVNGQYVHNLGYYGYSNALAIAWKLGERVVVSVFVGYYDSSLMNYNSGFDNSLKAFYSDVKGIYQFCIQSDGSVQTQYKKDGSDLGRRCLPLTVLKNGLYEYVSLVESTYSFSNSEETFSMTLPKKPLTPYTGGNLFAYEQNDMRVKYVYFDTWEKSGSAVSFMPDSGRSIIVYTYTPETGAYSITSMSSFTYDNLGTKKYCCTRELANALGYTGANLLYNFDSKQWINSATTNNGDGKYVTVRMLSKDATTYEKYYYKAAFKSNADTISLLASSYSMIQAESIKLSDDSRTSTYMESPTEVFYIPAYGELYDIVDTNDENLCALIGITMPKRQYWDSFNKVWKYRENDESDTSHSSSGTHFGGDSSNVAEDEKTSDESIGSVTDLKVSYCGTDELVHGSVYQQRFPHHSSNSDIGRKWGYGDKLTWTYAGEADAVKIVCYATFDIGGKESTLKLTVNDYDYNKPCNAGSGVIQIPYHKLMKRYKYCYGEITDFVSSLKSVKWAVIPFYKDADGKYHYGSETSVAHAFKTVMVCDDDVTQSATQDVVDNAKDDMPGLEECISGTWKVFDSILAFLTGIPELFGKMLGMIGGLIEAVGEVPTLLGALFQFIPTEIQTLIGGGLLTCIAIGVIRWIKG